MAWVRFIADFDWKPMSTVTIAYRAGQESNVTRACADAAAAKKKAVRLKKTSRDAAPIEAAQDA